MQVVKVLLEHEADVDIKRSLGKTPGQVSLPVVDSGGVARGECARLSQSPRWPTLDEGVQEEGSALWQHESVETVLLICPLTAQSPVLTPSTLAWFIFDPHSIFVFALITIMILSLIVLAHPCIHFTWTNIMIINDCIRITFIVQYVNWTYEGRCSRKRCHENYQFKLKTLDLALDHTCREEAWWCGMFNMVSSVVTPRGGSVVGFDLLYLPLLSTSSIFIIETLCCKNHFQLFARISTG